MKVYPENKKHNLCVISIENQFLVSFSWTQRSITQRRVLTLGSIFLKMVLNRAQGLREKVMKFQREKITTGWDITKNVEGGRFCPPALLGLKEQHCYFCVDTTAVTVQQGTAASSSAIVLILLCTIGNNKEYTIH